MMTRRWLGWLAAALVVALACTLLGRWQFGRYEDRIATERHLEANYNGEPVDIRQAHPDPAVAPTADQQWRQVRMTGDYLDPDRVLVRNRPLHKNYGFEVLVPFRTTRGEVVFVDRGWIPNGRTAAGPDSVPATPTGRVEVIGWLRSGEPNLERAGVQGQAASINIAQLRQLTGQAGAADGYVLMRSESGPGVTQARPQALPKPDPGGSAWINFSYAFQWWLAAAGVIAFVLLRARREHLDATGRAEPPKPTKQRIWDEEDD